jgi:hypothetical protein
VSLAKPNLGARVCLPAAFAAVFLSVFQAGHAGGDATKGRTPKQLRAMFSRIAYADPVTVVLRHGSFVDGSYLGLLGAGDSTGYAARYERWRGDAAPRGAPALGSRLTLVRIAGDTLRGTHRGLAAGVVALGTADRPLPIAARMAQLRTIVESGGGTWAADSVTPEWAGAPTVPAVIVGTGRDTLLVPWESISTVRGPDGSEYAVPRTVAMIVIGIPLGAVLFGLLLVKIAQDVADDVKR